MKLIKQKTVVKGVERFMKCLQGPAGADEPVGLLLDKNISEQDIKRGDIIKIKREES